MCVFNFTRICVEECVTFAVSSERLSLCALLSTTITCDYYILYCYRSVIKKKLIRTDTHVDTYTLHLKIIIIIIIEIWCAVCALAMAL